MRFALTHKATTYALLAFAYLAMTAGGGLEPTISILGGVGLLISWWWEPPIIPQGRWAWVWTVASVLVLLYSGVSAVATADYLRVGAEFQVWLVVAKACNRATARDWLQLYLLAFLMLVAGSVLNADLSYGVCFLGFVITSTWSLTLLQLRREMEDSFLLKHADDQPSERVQVRRILESRRIVGGRFLFGTAALSLGVFLGAAALFLALPRVGFGILGSRRGGLSMAGFSDGVRLGGHGVIKRDPTVVMRVEMPPRWGDRSAVALHWRGVSFETYSMGIWTRTGKAPVTHASVTQAGVRRERRVLLYDQPRRPPPAEMQARRTAAVQQNIYLDPLDTDVLFGASMPFIFETETPQRPMRAGAERNDEVRMRRTGTIHYQVWSEVQTPAPAVLRAAAETLPKGYEVYLGLPKEITAETRALAERITAGKTTRYDKAMALRDWLTTNLGYTLEQEEPGDQEPVHFFLFTRKKGHCEYFASAFAVMARAVGVPTRNVNGFLGGEWNEYDSYVAVRAGDAHSWAEVYFDGVGWVTFDATPPGQVDQMGRGDSGPLARMQRFLDTLRFQWAKWVIEYDLGRQLSVFRGVGNVLRDGARTVKDAVGAVWSGAKRGWPVAVGIALVAALWIWRRHRRRGGTGEAAIRRKLSPVAAALLDAERALARRGLGRDAAITPSEHAAALRRRAADEAGGDAKRDATARTGAETYAETYAELVALHQRVVWGQDRGGDPAAQAQGLAARLRDELAEDARARAQRAG
jgi:transglutaminase-like putative cysteine protease